MKRKLFTITVSFLLGCLLLPYPSQAAPNSSYQVSYWLFPTPSPVAYEPVGAIYGDLLGEAAWKLPEDLFVAPNGYMYVVDSGNNRIVVLDDSYRVHQIINSFQVAGIEDNFLDPHGIYMADDGTIYIADTGHARIVQLTSSGQFIRIIDAPKSDILSSGFKYQPHKVAVDSAGRIYAISLGTFDGIIEFSTDGTFSRFTGTNKVKFNVIDYIWKSISTQKQRDQMVTFVPIEFNNMDLDQDNFIYSTTTQAFSLEPIQRVNPKGGDVLRRLGYGPPIGDYRFNMSGSIQGSSVFSDIKVSSYGVYRGLDSKRGRIFSYDEDGNLLYVLGQVGSQSGTFKTPVAIDEWEEQIYVLDRDRHKITIFKPTRFGKSVNQAVMHQYLGDETKAEAAWNQVLQLNANFDIAYKGIGRAYYERGEYKEAIHYFKLGMDQEYYSKAYRYYRKEVIKDNFSMIMTTVILGILALVTWRKFRNLKSNKKGGGHGATFAE